MRNLNITLNSQSLNAFSPRSRIRQKCLISPILFTGDSSQCNRGGKGIQVGWADVKLCIFTENIIVHIENLMEHKSKVKQLKVIR